LFAGDGARAFAFYSAQFGWKKDRDFYMGPMGVYHIFEPGQLGGVLTKTPQTPAPFWLYYFNVDAIDAAAERVKAKNGRVTNGPMQVPTGQWIVQGLDPQGAMFALLAPNR
jgi:predicted enzyme related to lactoylglutathione lyase